MAAEHQQKEEDEEEENGRTDRLWKVAKACSQVLRLAVVALNLGGRKGNTRYTVQGLRICGVNYSPTQVYSLV